MKMQANWRKLLILVSLVLITALITIGTAFAEGEDPLPPEGVLPALTEQPSLAEQPPTLDPAPAEPASEPNTAEPLPELTAEPAAAEPMPAPAESSATAEAPVVEITAAFVETQITEPLAQAIVDLAALDITLAGEGGEMFDLASQATAETIIASDPYFYIGLTLYSFTTTDCFPLIGGNQGCTNPITEAINLVQAGYLPTDRKIYVESGSYSETVTVDGTQPFLNQLTGLIGVDTGTGFPVIHNKLTVHDVDFGFLLSGFNFIADVPNELVNFYDNSGTLIFRDLTIKNTSGSGLKVANHKGAVILTNVKSSGNTIGWGAKIDNSASGAYPVTITNSSFDHNNLSGPSPLYGLYIKTKSRVTLNGVTAQHNNGNGAQVEPTLGAAINKSTFNCNIGPSGSFLYGHGLMIELDAPTNAITLDTVQAADNVNRGIHIITGGAVVLRSFDGIGNGMAGAYINKSASAVITASRFNDNDTAGLFLQSLGSILINGIEASHNVQGALINNCLLTIGPPVHCEGSGGVIIGGAVPNLFNGNTSGIGLQIQTGGAVKLTNFEANDNGAKGVWIHNNFTGYSGSVTVNATYIPPTGTWKNSASGNGNEGLRIESFGTISVDKVVSYDNGQTGIFLTNFNAASVKNVLLKNSEAYENTGTGIQITSLGAISLVNTQSYMNVLQGANLNNGSGLSPISVINTAQGRFDHNQTYSLFVVSNGLITLRNLDASFSQQGANIDNNASPLSASVIISGSDFSNTSLSGGLWISSFGTVTLQNVSSSNNAGYGIYVGTTLFGGIYAQSASLTNVTANGNQSGSGIEVYSRGNITLSGINASGNSAKGLLLDACKLNAGNCDGLGGITLGGTGNTFDGNGEEGLIATSRGSILISNVSASGNSGIGLDLDNHFDNAAGIVKLSASAGSFNTVSGNDSFGLRILSNNAITIARTLVDGNAKGTEVNNTYPAAGKAVTISDSTFSYNQDTGLTVDTKGAVMLRGVQAVGNSLYNSMINTGTTVSDQVLHEPYMWEEGKFESWWFNGSGAQTITLKSEEFIPMVYLYDADGHLLAYDENSGSGITASISGFTLPAAGNYRIEVASQNNGFGVYFLGLNVLPGWTVYYPINGARIDNSGGSADVMVTLSGTAGNNFSDNNWDGLIIGSQGNITVNNAVIRYNGSYGAEFNNPTDLEKNILISVVGADENKYGGMYINSKGAVTISSSSADGNFLGDGLTLYNAGSPSFKATTIINSSFDNNGYRGLAIYSKGNITLTNVSASLNGSLGVYATNAGGPGGISITGEFEGSGFDNNGANGLDLSTDGAFKLMNSSADGNGDHGLYLEKTGGSSSAPVTVTGTGLKPASFNGNTTFGIFIIANGPVSLSSVEANDNSETGIFIINNSSAPAPKPITLSKVAANNNVNNGLDLRSSGPVTVGNISANFNHGNGMNITNDTLADQWVMVNRSTTSGNNGFGLTVYSRGDITLNGVTGSYNGLDGAYLDPVTAKKISVLSTLGENIFSGNSGSGLNINTSGAVTLSRVTADSNLGKGVIVNNASSLTIASLKARFNQLEGLRGIIYGNATITGSVFSNNDPAKLGNFDGIYLGEIPTASTVRILNSLVTANSGCGINLVAGPDLILTGTFYFGNDSNNSGQLDINRF